MIGKKNSKLGFRGAVFGFFFAIMVIFGGLFNALVPQADVYADTPETTQTENTEAVKEETQPTQAQPVQTASNVDQCQNSLGSIGWIVCPTTGKVAEAVDWLYEKIENILIINPVEAKDGSPIYEIWKYCRGITNIVFIIFLLVVIYSQITGLGISNYGIKKVLPKLIVVAVLVNLSFLLCSIAVDLSNVVGNSLRGVFENVEQTAVSNMVAEGAVMSDVDMAVSQTEAYNALAGGTALTVGGAVIAFETGAIWMLIPVLLGALVAVATGLITIALRQAVVALLIMIAPLAVVAYMLPNTEGLFNKWKKLLTQMLVFYPMFSLLFGASSLAGFAIVASAKDGFGVLLGTAVQIFPLFFSWKMMKMSDTFLGSINSGLQKLAAAPLAKNRSWADSHREATKQQQLAKDRAFTPSLRLMQYMSDRKVARDSETSDKATLVKNRGLAYKASRNYDRNGIPTKAGEDAYRDVAKSLEYQRIIERDKNNLNKGLGQLKAVQAADVQTKVRLAELDNRVVNASDYLKVEAARGEMIEYKNAEGFHNRMEDAINARMDEQNGYIEENGVKRRNPEYRIHKDANSARYDAISSIMEGSVVNSQFAAATAARSYDTQKKMIETAYQKYFEMAPPTRDLRYRLEEITSMDNAAKNYIDAIIPGLRILNQRGDTDFLKQQIDNMIDNGGLQLGTHAAQSLASFLMFEVKDADPGLRRFGKYLNLETARAYDKDDRQVMDVTYDEYIRGYHDEPDPEHPGQYKRMYAKRGMKELLEGTSFDGIERTALSNLDESLKKAYTDEDGNLDVDNWLKKREEIQQAVAPQIISASLKYLSGSEQLRSIVKFTTGYGFEQLKEEYIDENGERKERLALDENGEPKTAWVPIWADGKKDFKRAEDKKKAEEYYRAKTLKYLNDQTPSQILALRSDYYDPMREHLAKAYEDNDEMRGWSDEAIAERKEYMAKKAEIQTRYGDLPIEEARERREQDLAELRRTSSNTWAGAQFRQLLDAKGKLNQIYRTRRSGAANNAKDWVRGWLDLDNEIAITAKLERDRERDKKLLDEHRRTQQTANDDDGNGSTDAIYDEVTRASFISSVEELWQNLRTEDDEVFFEESLNYLKEILGNDSFIAAQYKKYHKDDPLADSYMLREYLKDLLSDEGNY